MTTERHSGSQTIPETDALDPIVTEMLTAMPLKEKVAIANMDESDVAYMQYAFDICVGGHLDKDADLGKDVMHRIWEELHKTHRMRCVK